MNSFWLKIAGLAVVVVGLIILVSVFFTSEPKPVEQPEGEREVQEVGDNDLQSRPMMKQQVEAVPNPKVDYVAKINELARAGRDETLNAAPFYQKAIDLYVEMPRELQPLQRNRRGLWGLWPADLPAKEQLVPKQWVQSNSQALSQLELGAKKPYYWLHKSSPDGAVMGVQMPELAKFRQLGRAITWRAKLTVAQGNIDKAVADIVTCYRFGLHMSSEPLLVEQLVGISIRALALGNTFKILDRTEMGQASMKSLQRQIEQLSTDESCIPDVRAENFSILDIIQRMFTDDGKGNGRIHMESVKPLLTMTMQSQQTQSLEKLQRRQTTESVEKLYEYFGFIARKTPWQWKNEQINPEKEIKKIAEGNAFVQMFCPAFVRVPQIFARCRAETDALITTLALLRYKADKGQLPEKLHELVSAGYLKALPNDPFSASQFVYKRIGGDFILYSFGTDCDDDGGTHNRSWDKDDQVFWPVQQTSR